MNEEYILVFFASLVVFPAIFGQAFAQDILGCGGFVKSDVEINFSRVEIKLLTKQGSLKYQTDCAPNNGYYMIPLYDKGEYVLKVEPPVGWSFEPESVDLTVDGINDPCSKNEDINFQFTGFGVEGQVLSKTLTEGPSGVIVSLMKADNKVVLQTKKTGQKGFYKFSKVLPGDYVIEASHPKWKFEKSSVSVKVSKENGQAGSGLVVAGYDVKGQVFSEGEPIKGVSFVLFSKKIKQKAVGMCDTSPVKGVTPPADHTQLCYVVSQDDGSFEFPSLPCGEYTLVPFYKGEKITFDVLPETLAFTVGHGTVVLETAFQVAGFSVTGKVLNVAKGQGVENAKIKVNGKEQGITDKNGVYHLENMKTGTYKLQVDVEKMQFDETEVKITPNTPELADIVAARFEVCGSVSVAHPPKGQSLSPRKITFSSQGEKSSVITLSTDKEGNFCTFAKPGEYLVKPVITEQEAASGLKLVPGEKKVMVTNGPVASVTFTQFAAKVSGIVNCLEDCKRIHVSLTPIGRNEGSLTARVKETGKTATFSLKNLLPGKYKVNLLNDIWCWKEKSVEVEITDQDVTGIEFKQTGYILSITVSHEIVLVWDRYIKRSWVEEQNRVHKFEQEKKEGIVAGTFELTKGLNRFCLKEPGSYKLIPESCHEFDKENYQFNTSKPTPLTLTALKHRIDGVVVTPNRYNDIRIKMKVFSKEGESETIVGPLQFEKLTSVYDHLLTGPFNYRFHHWTKAGDKVEFTPLSKSILFYPAKLDVHVKGDACPGDGTKFEGKEGVFIKGRVQGPIGEDGVQMLIMPKNNDQVRVQIQTRPNGHYEYGPLHGNTEYIVRPEKPGYIFQELQGFPYYFKATRLARINVKVVGEKDEALGGVLLSLSGGDSYRSNNLTFDNGTMVFENLAPGDYFLRQMMKEYKFEPASQMITIKEGSSVEIKIKGSRVAFSCYGAVTSLNGEPEPGVVVEAVGLEGCAQYQEESKTEQDGTYRIRGLQPKCSYRLQLKDDPVNQHIARAEPKAKEIKPAENDLRNVNIIAFRRINQMDLSGNIITTQEYLNSLKVRLYKEDNLDSPIHTSNLGLSTFFYLPSVPNDKEQSYVIRLESTLAKSMYDYTLPEVKFTANESYKHFTFKFAPKRKSLDQELNQGSFLILPFTLLVIAAAYHYQKLIPLLFQAVNYVKNIIQSQSTGSGTSSSAPMSGDMVTEEVNKKKKSRKIN